MNQNHRNPLASAISYALGAGMVAGLAFTASPVIAQDDQDAALDRIQVTGSRIQRTDVESTSPLLTVSREAILASGLQNVGDVLRNLNQADSLGLTNLTSDTNANDGTQTISLRGLGSARTLVLVNGRRWLALGGGAVDTSQIPTQVIERIEVLGDGASAVYGSDAIAGVINIILRDDFEGMEVDLSYGENWKGDGENTVYSFTTGHRGDRGSLIFNITRNDQEEIGAGDRSISRTPVAFVPTARGSAFGRQGIFFAPSLGVFHLNPDREQPGLAPGERSTDDFLGGTSPFNFAPTNFLLTPSTRLSTFTRGTFDITDDIQFFGQFTYNQRKSRTEIAPVPTTAVPSLAAVGPQWNFPISADSVFNPFDVDIEHGFRMPGNRTNVQDFDTYFGTFGVQGSFDVGNRPFDWDIAYSRGESSRSSTGENFVNLLRLSQGVGPSFIDEETGQAVCGTPENPTPFLNGLACVPVDMMNGISGLTPEMLNFINQSLVEKQNAGLTEWQVNLAGQLFDLPAGPIGFAIGAERRTNQWENIPDSTITGGLNSSNFQEPTKGSQTAEEAYFEVAVPVLRDLPGVKFLEFSVAGRFSDFENNGLVGDRAVSESFSNESFKFGVRWDIFDDLMFRANYSETFRAPSVNNLFLGGAEGFPAGIDPCASSPEVGAPFLGLSPEEQARCFATGVGPGGSSQQTTQLRGLFGGNPSLQPEEGDTKTIGLVYNPRWLDGLDLSVDFWDIQLEDTLASRGLNPILNGCIRDGNLDDCAFIERGPTGNIQQVRLGQFNLASARIKGYDGQANYRWSTDNAGRFDAGLAATYTSSAKLTLGPLSEAQSVVGNAVGLFQGPTWRWRANASLNWSMGDFGLTYSLRYLHSLTEACNGFEVLEPRGQATRQLCSNPDIVQNPAAPGGVASGGDSTNNVGSVTYHDVSATYETPWNSTIRAGVRNLFQKDPPFMVTPFANSFDQAYDIPGGFWFVSYNQRF
jgi:iron complex outermembrane receptor protein